MNIPSLIALFCSVLVPTKMWFNPKEPININVKADAPIVLMLTDFAGKPQEAKGSPEVAGTKEVNIKDVFPALTQPGTYLLYAVPKGKKIEEFVGTPLVIGVRNYKNPDYPQDTIVVRVEPLRYAVMSTDAGDMTIAFWYDVAPNTANNFLTLASEGFYDGLTFHRILAGFVVQGGDPHGDGVGGPGFNIGAEFNDRKHEEGVLSMARNGDPRERTGAMPAPEFANSAGSQFFICLGSIEHLNNRYTGFGQVVEGKEAYQALAKTELGDKPGDKEGGKPKKPPVIKKVQVLPVTASKNPYKPAAAAPAK